MCSYFDSLPGEISCMRFLVALFDNCWNIKISVFWKFASCSLLKIYRLSEVLTALFAVPALIMDAISTVETSVNFYKTTRYNISEDSHLHIHFRVNFEPHMLEQ
jgi:hypothetical protein